MFKHWTVKVRGPLAYLFLIGVIAAGAWIGPYLLRAGFESFQPLDLTLESAQAILPVSNTAPVSNTRPPGITQPLTNRVVLVVVSGLSRDSLNILPALQETNFKQTSTRAQLFTTAVPPRVPGLVTLLTGASLELTGGFTFDTAGPAADAPLPALQMARLNNPEACGNLLTCVKRNKNTTAFFGTPDWYTALKPEWLDYNAAFPVEQPATDISDAALNFLKKKSANFTLIQFGSVRRAELDFGYNSPEALQARQNLNDGLARLTDPREIELNRTTLIITGDWDDSTQAGDRWTVPMLMVGQAVQPGDTFWGQQEDITSTVAALLGVEVPRANQGRILTTALAMPSLDLAEKMLALVEQRRALAQAYRLRLGLPLPLAVNDPQAVDAEKSLRVAVQDYRLGSYDNVESVVDPVLRTARQDMTQAREEWFAQERGQRAIISAGLLLIPLLALIIWRSGLAVLALLGSAVAAALPYLFYLTQSRPFAFSNTTPAMLQEDSLWRSGLALAAGLILPAILFDWAERRRRRIIGRVHLDYTLIAGLRVPRFPFRRLFAGCFLILGWLVYFSGAIWFIWFYWRFGLVGSLGATETLALPEFNAIFMLLFALNHLLGFALWLTFAPLALAALFALKRRLVGDGERSLDEEFDLIKQPSPESGVIIKA